MTSICAKYVMVLLVLLGICSFAQADWINFSGAENSPNIAEIYILDDHVRLVLEIYVGDLFEFEQLLPDDLFRDGDVKRPLLTERLKTFSQETFQFVTEKNTHLQAQLKLIEPRLRQQRPTPFAGMINPMTGRPVPGPPQDKRVIYAELI